MLNQQDTPKTQAQPETELSATEGQETTVLEAVSAYFAPEKQPETGRNLDPETAPLEAPEVEIVFQQSETENPSFSQESVDLAKALADSAELEAEPEVLARAMPERNLVDQAMETAKLADWADRSLSKPAPEADGSLSVLLKISEEYVAGVEEAAKTDGRSVDQWCTERFQEYLEAYYSPTKGR